jgi:hypothetical protein
MKMLAPSREIVTLSSSHSHVSIYTGPDSRPIEVTVTGKLARGTGSFLVDSGLHEQQKHPEFLDLYNEPSAVIGKTGFEDGDPTAIYTFGVDKRDLVFHRHAGHRVITGITGGRGCILKFSLSTPEEAVRTPEKFIEKLYMVYIPGDRMFVLRFSGTVYHQFCPADPGENAFFAVSVHTNEAKGLTGELLETVLSNESSIPLLTEPAPDSVMRLLNDPSALYRAVIVSLDID